MPDPTLPQERTERSHIASGGLEHGVQIDDFVIERRLGAGGMGIVYQARQISLNRVVALKVLGQALSYGSDVTRFQREAQAAARLKHPAIAQVYFIGQDKHLCYMAMELVDGLSLRRVLDRLGSTTTADTSLDTIVKSDQVQDSAAIAVRFDLPTEVLPVGVQPLGCRIAGQQAEACTPTSDSQFNPYVSPRARELRTSAKHIRRCAELAREAAAALAHAHQQGVIHRDIKPDNLILDREGKLHLIDFGVARFFEDQGVTCTGQLVGTPLYMSPEQVTGRGGIDARTDIYSLGLVLYELLTLRPPIDSVNRENLLRNIVTKPLPPVGWRNESIPEDLARIVHKATQKDPDQRYASATEMVADLERFLGGIQVAAPSYHYQFDEREITAARPGGVVLSAFVIAMVAAVVSLGLASVAIMTLFIAAGPGLVVAATQAVIAVGIVVAGGFVSRALLAARTWARWVAVAGFALVCLLSLLSVTGLLIVATTLPTMMPANSNQAPGTEPAEAADDGELATFDPNRFMYGMIGMYSLPPVVGLFMGAAGIWWLLGRRTGEWFAFAAHLREEHRRLKEEFQQ